MNQHDDQLPPHGSRRLQQGGFGLGLIVGLLIGLSLALGVALYVTKVPVPFMNKVQLRSPAQDAAEAEKNKNWDPNSPLYGKNPARPSAIASGVVTPPPTTPDAGTASGSAAPGMGAGTGTGTPMIPPVATVPPTPAAPASAGRAASSAAVASRASQPSSGRDPAAILADRAPATRPAVGGDAGGISSTGTGTTGGISSTGADPFTYYVQAGAYGTPEDAEQQRARLAMMGLEARLSERDQSGRTVHRVRLGPFDTKAAADAARERLSAAGMEATLVRVQR